MFVKATSSNIRTQLLAPKHPQLRQRTRVGGVQVTGEAIIEISNYQLIIILIRKLWTLPTS